jgi:hypothetical protein
MSTKKEGKKNGRRLQNITHREGKAKSRPKELSDDSRADFHSCGEC